VVIPNLPLFFKHKKKITIMLMFLFISILVYILDIDECKVDPCFTSDYSSTADVRSISNALCKNTIGGHTCYNLTGATCEFWANGSVRCYNITSEATRSNKRMHLFSGVLYAIQVLGPLLLEKEGSTAHQYHVLSPLWFIKFLKKKNMHRNIY
jgi:hypothetical protein